MSKYISDLDLEEFKANVNKWLSIDDDIMKLNKALRDLKKKKKELTPKISIFMEKNEIKDCETGDGLLKHNITYVKKPLSRKLISDKLILFLRNEKKAQDATEFIYDNRDMEKKTTLKRKIDKKKNAFSLK